MPKKTSTKQSAPKKTRKRSTTRTSAKTVQRSIPEPRVERKFVPLLIVFFAVVVLTAGIIFYTAFSKTTITVTTAPIDEEREFTYVSEEVAALVEAVEFEHTYTYDAFADAPAEPAQATGRVTLTNDYSVDQPLVATTRLLSDSGVLFRTQDTVTVPAGGTVEVDVYADEEGGSGNIDPARFEIVALSESLKPSIYADSTAAMTGGLIGGTPVTQADIDTAKQLASEEMLEEAIVAITEQAESTIDTALISANTVALEIVSQDSSAEVDEPAAEITINSSVVASVAIVDKNVLAESISLETNTQVKPQRVSYEVAKNDDGSTAIVATAPIYIPVDDLSFIKKNKLAGKTGAQVEALVLQYDQVEAVEVRFNPFWVRTTPLTTDSIVLELAN